MEVFFGATLCQDLFSDIKAYGLLNVGRQSPWLSLTVDKLGGVFTLESELNDSGTEK